MSRENRRSWTKDETAILIKKYESYPELWNSCIRDYKDRHKKFLATKALAAYFNTTPTEISRKVHNMRCQMSNEIRKAKKYDRSHATRGVYVSSWEFYNSLKFIIAGAAYNSYDFPEDNEESYQQSDTSNPYESKPTSSPKVKRHRKRFKSPTPDDDQVFGNFVASKLRNMRSDIHRRKLKRMIQSDILQICYGEGPLEPNTDTDSKHHFTCFSSPVPIPVYNSSPVHYSDDTSK